MYDDNCGMLFSKSWFKSIVPESLPCGPIFYPWCYSMWLSQSRSRNFDLIFLSVFGSRVLLIGCYGPLLQAATLCPYPCPVGTYSAAGSASCTICPAGQFSGSKPQATQCLYCSPGQYSFQNTGNCLQIGAGCYGGTIAISGALNVATNPCPNVCPGGINFRFPKPCINGR